MHVLCYVKICLCNNNICVAVIDADETSATVHSFCQRTSNGGATRWRHTQALIGFVYMTDDIKLEILLFIV